MSCTLKYQRFHGNKFIFVFVAFYLQMDINSIYLQSILMFYVAFTPNKKKTISTKINWCWFQCKNKSFHVLLTYRWLYFFVLRTRRKSKSRFCVLIHHYKIDFALKIFSKLAHGSKLLQLIQKILINDFNIDDFIA